MKSKLSLLFSLAFFTLSVKSQNVGIGTTQPKEKLDVNGNVNINGELKFNQVGGQPGQFIMKSSSNTLVWANPSETYSNNFTAIVTGSKTFIVPEGVTRLMVEIWGAGGGGSIEYQTASQSPYIGGSGGGGGGYARALLNVTAGDAVTYLVGSGGTLYADNSIPNNTYPTLGNNGEASSVTIGGITLSAGGGNGATKEVVDGKPASLPGEGGGYKGPTSINSSIRFFTGVSGENGTYPISSYSTVSSIESAYEAFGDGGNAGNTTNTGGYGARYRKRPQYGGATYNQIGAKQPGGGGGGSTLTESGTTAARLNGAPGMVIFWW